MPKIWAQSAACKRTQQAWLPCKMFLMDNRIKYKILGGGNVPEKQEL